MVKRGERSRVLNLLHTLNYFYSLRDLEEMLGVPFQNLWRYVNLLSVPEEKTTEKILSRIQELNLIEETVRRVLSDADVEIWSLAREPSFLRLFSLVIEELVEREKIDVIVPLSEYAIPLASIVAMELEKSLCPVLMHNVKSEKEGFYVAHYTSCKNDELRMIALPKRNLHGRESALMIDITVDELDHIDAVAGIMRRAKINDQSLIAIQLSKDIYLKLANNRQGIRVIKVFNII